jgi:hypothetical protein
MGIASTRALGTRVKWLRKLSRHDRVLFTLKATGTVTGRAAGALPPFHLPGIQPQNINRKDRDLFLPEDGYWFAKADLEGADSWTVAAMLASLGDKTMLHDLETGVKPAQALLVAYYFGGSYMTATSEDIKAMLPEALKRVKEEKAKGVTKTSYDIMKAVAHGTSYLMGPGVTQNTLFKLSEGELWVERDLIKQTQSRFYIRYRMLSALQAIIGNKKVLVADSGHTRHTEHLDAPKKMSFFPQANTTYVTNMAIHRLFLTGGSIVRPINQVHDEMDLLIKKDKLEDAKHIIQRAAGTILRVGSVDFRIPFEVNYGANWGECTQCL